MPGSLSSTLTRPPLVSAARESLLYLAPFQTFKPTDHACHRFCRRWVVAAPGHISIPTTKPSLGSAAGELLLSLVPCQTH